MKIVDWDFNRVHEGCGFYLHFVRFILFVVVFFGLNYVCGKSV